MDKSAISHLNNDPILATLTEKYPLAEITDPDNLYLSLIDIITSQQLSTKAGTTIFNRLLALLPSKKRSEIVPDDLLSLSPEDLRKVGLSTSKANYIHHLSHAIKNKELDLDEIKTLSDEEVTKEITKLKGLGPWSAEMFLIFSLNRPDVFSVGDLGLRTAISRLYNLDRDNHQKILELSQTWSPYRSFACRLLWKSLDNS